ncbi:MAG: ThuA domain-containing protein, partial [Bacteroidota bacterium]
ANILDSAQRVHFEQYMAAGGNMMGIHAATDTYRHSSANGGWTGEWDYYAETLGASVQTGPNHTWNLHGNFMDHQSTNNAIINLPSPWYHAEEYYYWENGYFDSTNNHVLLKVRETDRGGAINSYDSARAVSWIKDNPGGGQVFYTALGHNKSSYQYDPNFKIHIRDAILALTAAPPPVLGISWLSFELDQIGNANSLNWTAELGEALGNFLIERRSEQGAWQEIAQLSTNSSDKDSYQYIDKHPGKGKLYYRIAFLDLAGEVSYSHIREVESATLGEINLNNPIEQMLTLDFRSRIRGEFQLEVININGATVLQDRWFKKEVETSRTFKLGQLAPGIYVIKISAKDVNFTRRILKL